MASFCYDRFMADSTKQLKVSIIGSFRKSPNELKKLFFFVEEHYTLLSPKSINWENPDDEFVRVESQPATMSIAEIENEYLDALRDSDFIILFAPKGYVGSSATYELGFAKALGIPVLSTYPIANEILSMIVTAGDFLPYENEKIDTPPLLYESGEGLKALQNYYARAAKRRGWDQETAKDTLLLLTEELGELARAVRKHENMKRDHAYDVDLSDELADVQLYLLHLANQTGINLGDSVTKKEAKNEERTKNR